MTSWVVVDSGLYLSVALNEPLATATKAFLDSLVSDQIRIGAPFLFRYELIAVIRKHIYRGSITLEDGRLLAQGLLRAPVEIFTAEVLLPRALELANQFNRPTAYDSVYLALAERLECEFWTADSKLFNAVNARLTRVKWIGNYTPL